MNGIAFRDVLMNTLFVFLIMVILMLPYINDPAKEASAEPPGNLIVAITWPGKDTPTANNDVDLWVWHEQEVRPVGYSNKGGVLFNLLRDDLGMMPDATALNYENAYTRGIVPGRYWVNVHCYRCPVVPVAVEVEISVNTGEPGKGSLRSIATTTVQLSRNGEEKTALSFELTDDGQLVKDSMNNVLRRLRATQQPGG